MLWVENNPDPFCAYLEQFRRCVGGRPAERVQVLVDLVHLGGEAKVPNLDQGHVWPVGVGGGGGGRGGGGGGRGPEEEERTLIKGNHICILPYLYTNYLLPASPPNKFLYKRHWRQSNRIERKANVTERPYCFIPFRSGAGSPWLPPRLLPAFAIWRRRRRRLGGEEHVLGLEVPVHLGN